MINLQRVYFGGAAVLVLASSLAAGVIPPEALNSVVALGYSDSTGKHWVGSGFLYRELVRKISPDRGLYDIYLVSNAHVIQAVHRQGAKETLVRFNPVSSAAMQEYSFPMQNKDGEEAWFLNISADVAVAPFDLPQEVRQRITGFDAISSENAADRARMAALGVSGYFDFLHSQNPFSRRYTLRAVLAASRAVITRTASSPRSVQTSSNTRRLSVWPIKTSLYFPRASFGQGSGSGLRGSFSGRFAA